MKRQLLHSPTFLLFYPLLLLQLLFFPLLTSGDSFINCGSSDQVSDFVGDESHDPSSNFTLTRGGKAITNNHPTSQHTSKLYLTARVFREASRYEFNNLTGNNTFLVRLHFFPFASKGENLFSSVFNVSTSSFVLLHVDFTLLNSSSNSSSPVIKELYIYLAPEATKLSIYFVPDKGSSAFVNAMEVIGLRHGYLSNDTSNGRNVGLLSNAFRNVRRVNVGGDQVNDSYGREWETDASYCSNSTSQNVKIFQGANLAHGYDFVAPDEYYRSCRYLQNESSVIRIFWDFHVARSSRHLLRAHFCDIVGDRYMFSSFYFYVNDATNMTIDVSESVFNDQLAFPFWKDYVVESDGDGLLHFSIGTGDDTQDVDPLAYLNGLEIMEFVEMGNLSQELLDMKDDEKSDKFPFVVVGSVAGCIVGVSLLVLLLLGWRMWWSKRAKKGRKLKNELPNGRGRTQHWVPDTAGSVSPIPNLNLKLKMAFGEILDATQNFDARLLIGEGGFGKVYRGTLKNGTKVAVKRSDSSNGQGLPEFRTEVIVLSKIRHRHLVSLIGYCAEGSEMILVYEYMEKGTLREHLYNWKDDIKLADRKSELNWEQRLEICLGSAKGLHYLHTGSDGGIIHRDVKSTNILLDEHLVAKVADFGLSQAGPQDPEHFSTGVKGSFGYLDPEYFRTLQLTEKSDVYSFGVVLLEVLCARPPIVRSAQKEEINLAEWGMLCLNKGELEKIIDPSIAGQIKPSSLRKFGEIAEKCLRPEGADRPSMLDVCWDLEYALQLQKTAAPRAPHEDTTTNSSGKLILPVAEALSIVSIDVDVDGPFSVEEEDSHHNASGVFSQLNIDGGR